VPFEKDSYGAGEIIGKGPVAMRLRAAAAEPVSVRDLELARYHATRKETEAGVMAFLLKFWKEFERCNGYANRLEVLRNAARKKFVDVPDFVLESLRYEFDRMKDRALETKIIPCALCTKPSDHRHHVIQLQFGGPNHLSNLIGLCDSCHPKVHG